jgi:hypothetical protein
MHHVRKIGLLLLVLGVMAAFSQAAKQERPDATLRLSGGSFAAGIGFSWGKGTLTYKGKEYPISVNGLSIGKVGITGVTAVGEVYNLRKLGDFDGHYNAAGVGLTVAGGGSAAAMKNQNGVRVIVNSTNRGVDITIGGGGVDMRLRR